MHLQAWSFAAALLVASCSSAALGATAHREDFGENPQDHGWKIFGDDSLFEWSPALPGLKVRWDSSRPNSYFAKKLGRTLTRADDFELEFEIELESLRVGVRPEKPFTFQLAVGFLDWSTATNQSFKRGTAVDSPNLVEFDYFADSGFGATLSPVIISSNKQFAVSFTFPAELLLGEAYHVRLNYRAADSTLRTSVNLRGESAFSVKPVVLPAGFTDFRVDTLAIANFSDVGSNGSLQASGLVRRIQWVTPDLETLILSGRWSPARFEISFASRVAQTYRLERTADLLRWETVAMMKGTGGTLTVGDSDTTRLAAFYRVTLIDP